MVTKHLGKSKTILLGLMAGIFSVVLNTFLLTAPVSAASDVQVEWESATSVQLGGSAVTNPITIIGNLVSNVPGTPAGMQSFMANTSGPVNMSFNCKVSMTLLIKPDAQGNLDYSKGSLIFIPSPPSNCSKEVLVANINNLVAVPFSGTDNLTLDNVTLANVDKRGAGNGNDSPDKQFVNVTAGLGAASDYNGLPQTDTFMLCEAKGDYVNNVNALYADCLAQKSTTLSAPILTSGSLQTLQNGKGPSGTDEKAWTGQFKDVKAAVYVACSANFKACQLFTKNPGEVAEVYVIFGATAGSVIPGTPPGQGQGTDEKVCTTGDGLAGALAWVLCPAVQLIASSIAFLEENIIVPFMTVSPLTTNADNPVYILWQNVRNIANIVFIGIFLIIIISQATSTGVSNLGIKRILPKGMIAIGAANLSYPVAAGFIDAFNIFGAGASQLVMAALQQAGTTQLDSGTSAGAVRSIFTLGGAALVTVVVSAGAAVGWFFSFLGLALLVVVIAVLVLIMRQLGIIGLVIASPVLIAISVLPNGEPTSKKAGKLFLNLLAMYPGMVLLFAAGKIFGVILQQPDFKIAGEGITDDMAQAVRVFLQAIVGIAPLALFPTLLAAGGVVTGALWSAASGRFIKPRANRLREDAATIGNEAKLRAARMPGIGKVAGFGMRRNYVRQSRQKNLEREQQEYIAGAVGDSGFLRRQAAGVSGKQGQTRAAAYAANVASKGRTEDLDAEMALLNDEMRNLGTDQKTFAAAAGRYLEKPDDPDNRVFTGSSGRTFNFKDNESRLQRALLNSAASQGEIKGVEAARLNPNIDQTMVDDVIRRNDGKLKEKGGYHLATRFDLANGRIMRSNSTGEALDTNGNVFKGLPGQQGDFITDEGEAAAEVAKQRVIAIANTGYNSVAGMKAGLLGDTATLISTDPSTVTDPEKRTRIIDAQAAIRTIDPALRARLKSTANEILSNKNTLAKSEADPKVFSDIRDSTLL